MKKTGWLLCAALLVGPAHGRQSPPPNLDSLLKAVTGAADKIIETDARESFKNFDSLIVLHQGRTAFEKYYNGVQGGAPHTMQSQTKSITALLLGAAIDQGFIKSENEKVAPYFPDSFDPADKLKAAMTIKDLLTMSPGIDWEEMLPQDDPKNDNMNMLRSDDWLAYVLARPMAVHPRHGLQVQQRKPDDGGGHHREGDRAPVRGVRQEGPLRAPGNPRIRLAEEHQGILPRGRGAVAQTHGHGQDRRAGAQQGDVEGAPDHLAGLDRAGHKAAFHDRIQ